MKFFVIVFFCVIWFKSNSQTIAPDFSLVDVNGTNVNLYNELNLNKTVILDFYTVSCGTCINNITTNENLWQIYGYNGDSLWFWGIEVGTATDSTIVAFNQQYNVTYPTFSTSNNDSIISLYNITYAPQYCVICSNKLMKFITVSNLAAAINGCKQITNSTNIDYQAQKKWFKYYNNELHFYLLNSELPATFKIYNLFGSLLYDNVLNSNADILNLFFLNNGVYLISIYTSSGNILNAKILKN